MNAGMIVAIVFASIMGAVVAIYFAMKASKKDKPEK